MTLTEFYPTPPNLIDKMLDSIDMNHINTVLEPSAGKGNLVRAVSDKMRHGRRYTGRDDYSGCVDCIEIDENLRHILKGYKYRVVHDDFLTYHSRKIYDLIIMNPPFSDGDKHLLRALDMQQQYGG